MEGGEGGEGVEVGRERKTQQGNREQRGSRSGITSRKQ